MTSYLMNSIIFSDVEYMTVKYFNFLLTYLPMKNKPKLYKKIDNILKLVNFVGGQAKFSILRK